MASFRARRRGSENTSIGAYHATQTKIDENIKKDKNFRFLTEILLIVEAHRIRVNDRTEQIKEELEECSDVTKSAALSEELDFVMPAAYDLMMKVRALVFKSLERVFNGEPPEHELKKLVSSVLKAIGFDFRGGKFTSKIIVQPDLGPACPYDFGENAAQIMQTSLGRSGTFLTLASTILTMNLAASDIRKSGEVGAYRAKALEKIREEAIKVAKRYLFGEMEKNAVVQFNQKVKDSIASALTAKPPVEKSPEPKPTPTAPSPVTEVGKRTGPPTERKDASIPVEGAARLDLSQDKDRGKPA
jgi:hypothetical protein